MLKNKNNFEITHSFLHCYAKNFSDYPPKEVEVAVHE
jgi:hypothetical protein